MRALLMPMGSHGDVLPLLGLGRALQAHPDWQVKALISPVFANAATAAGLDYRPLGTVEDYNRAQNDPNLHSFARGMQAVSRVLEDLVRLCYRELIAELELSSEPTVLIGTTLAFPIRLAQETHGLPTVMVHLSPAVFRSNLKPPVLSPLGPLPGWLPPWLLQGVWWLTDRLMLDPLLGGPMNRVRRELGLKPVRGVMDQWMHQVDRSLALFPDWFFPPPKDWPSNLQLTGFPLWDIDSHPHLDPELEEWLNAGEAPVVITGGTAFTGRRKFYEQCLAACTQLGRRALVVTRHRGNMPQGSFAVEYAPFSLLLPRSAAIIHHGGIGTVAQALACGTRQLVLPQAHDQFDNAHLVERLGTGRWCRRPGNLGRDLGQLLQQECRRYPVQSGLPEAARAIISLASLPPNNECG
jgi:rhamnosyltransferase subunit B